MIYCIISYEPKEMRLTEHSKYTLHMLGVLSQHPQEEDTGTIRILPLRSRIISKDLEMGKHIPYGNKPTKHKL